MDAVEVIKPNEPREPQPTRAEIHARYLILLDKLQKARAQVET